MIDKTLLQAVKDILLASGETGKKAVAAAEAREKDERTRKLQRRAALISEKEVKVSAMLKTMATAEAKVAADQEVLDRDHRAVAEIRDTLWNYTHQIDRQVVRLDRDLEADIPEEITAFRQEITAAWNGILGKHPIEVEEHEEFTEERGPYLDYFTRKRIKTNVVSRQAALETLLGLYTDAAALVLESTDPAADVAKLRVKLREIVASASTLAEVA